MNSNSLSGSIPTTISALTNLQIVSLSGQPLTGRLEALAFPGLVYVLQLHHKCVLPVAEAGLSGGS